MIKRAVALLSFLMFTVAPTVDLFAFTLLTQEEALKEVFFSGAEIEKRNQGTVRRNSRENQGAVGRQPDLYPGRL